MLGANANKRHRHDAFVQLLADADCTLVGSDAPIVGSAGPARLHLQLERRLADATPALVRDFLSGLQLYVDDELSLTSLLNPIASAASTSADSLARLLLALAPIQAQVASLLLDKLPEYFGVSDVVPRIILHQFRWLDYVADSASVTRKLLDIVSIAPLNLKKEMITSLPELVSDADHGIVMTYLEEMLREDLQLLVPVLDALSNLNLDKSLGGQAVEIALVTLRSADPDDLPLVVRFLLQSATSDNARRIVQQLRHCLNFVTVSASKQDRKLKSKSSANCEALVLDALRSGLRFNDLICDATLREIRNIQGERNHKNVDILLLLVLHANGGPQRKASESLLKRKVINCDIGTATLGLCIQGHGSSLRDYFQTLLCISGSMLRSKERQCLQFGIKLYILLFEEFVDTYHRQEVLGSLVTHTGAGIADEVDSALNALLVLADNDPHALLPMSSFINVLLDHMESFSIEGLHQVFRIFGFLAMTCWPSDTSRGHSSVADELLIIIQKQVTNSDLRYKHMGIIGVITLLTSINVESDQNDIIELLQMTLGMCKRSPVALQILYDELASQLESKKTHVSILEWAAKHINEFESTFLGDLAGGHVLKTATTSELLEGELWMNLDGEESPVFLNILPMVLSHDQSILNSLRFLPANLRLLAAVERSMNNGLLGSIDALLGCPMYLPKASVLSGSYWAKLSKKQKELSCMSLFYAINWIRELINTFSTYLESSNPDLFQTLIDNIVAKLFSRLRHLLTLQYVLFHCLESIPDLVFPQLHCFHSEQDCGQGAVSVLPDSDSMSMDLTTKKSEPSCQRKPQKTVESHTQSCRNCRQGTMFDDYGQASTQSSTENAQQLPLDFLGQQQWKRRPLTISSFNLLATPQADVQAQLPLYLYLMQELSSKLESFCKQPPLMGTSGTPSDILLTKVLNLLPSIRTHLDTSAAILKESEPSAKWSSQVGTFEISTSKWGTSRTFLCVTFRCLSKILQLPGITTQPKLFLKAFESRKSFHDTLSHLLLEPPKSSVDQLSYMTFGYFEEFFNAAVRASVLVVAELVELLQYLVKFLEALSVESNEEPVTILVVTHLSQKLGLLAKGVLENDWNNEPEKVWKGKHDILQRLIRLMIQRCPSPTELVEDLSKNVMIKVGSSIPGYPTLCSSTLAIWYRVQHEVILDHFTALVKEALMLNKVEPTVDGGTIANLLSSGCKCVSAHVSLIIFTKTLKQDKTSVYSIALRYGGKFVEIFLKGLQFLEAHYNTHKTVIKNMVKEMQKATRTIQSICSEAKGQKNMSITCKVPAVKRSMERYVFQIKSLLHRASTGSTTFWMGNLKHKDLQGNEVSSQIFASDDEGGACSLEEEENLPLGQDA